MRRRVSFHHLAEDELNEAAEYYERVSPGLGVSFLDEAEQAIQRILEFPESAPDVGQRVRRRLVNRFPYGGFVQYP